MAVAAQEPHLGHPLFFERKIRLVEVFKDSQCLVRSGQGIVESLPYIVDIPGSSHYAG